VKKTPVFGRDSRSLRYVNLKLQFLQLEIVLFALAKTHGAMHKGCAFQASSPKL
jgi:hypothetical protein